MAGQQLVYPYQSNLDVNTAAVKEFMHGPSNSWLCELNSDPTISPLRERAIYRWTKQSSRRRMNSSGLISCFSAVWGNKLHPLRLLPTPRKRNINMLVYAPAFPPHTSKWWSEIFILYSRHSLPPKPDHLAMEHIARWQVNNARPLLRRVKWSSRAKVGLCIFKGGPNSSGLYHSLLLLSASN